MKTFFLLVTILCSLTITAQKKILTKTASISFEGSVDSFEPVQAENKNVTVVMDEQGNLAALALMRGFKFPIALMEEHFNENYMESDQYPKAVLRGTIVNFTSIPQDGIAHNVELKGNLEMHGVKRAVTVPIRITRSGDTYGITATFDILPRHYDIAIPSVVRNKIAESIKVTVKANLSE
ncbi:YceI family protein [Nonlabens xiamenensis]|uniref:YceI family protein n=1 Tax=Nonlabens xiamenensis TaxID=2341043 RepID=UPI0013DD9420|nr:YceI family protein [Nonlabens xiamenensis]